MTVITRFAPSPTGQLHIGGARTALFNWLYARHFGGTFLLRIEDTDRLRSTQENVDIIMDNLKWLGLDWDEDIVYQFARANRHAQVAHDLVKQGKAYYCYCSPEELELMREKARAAGLSPRYDGTWRDKDPSTAPAGVKPVVRFKAPQNGTTIINDLVQGKVEMTNNQLDDMILLRADGTPTYMLSVVVDDHDMKITHIIRGDDHLNNAFRQYHLYKACGWDVPEFAHIPLIHGADGAKLSKRHGATGTDFYEAQGFLPDAMFNYLLRLGWSHGDDEIISRNQAIEWFDLPQIGQSPARFDMAKLTFLNAHYLKESSNEFLTKQVLELLAQDLGAFDKDVMFNRILNGMDGLKTRSKTLIDLAASAKFYISLPNSANWDDKAQSFITPENKQLIANLIDSLQNLKDFKTTPIEQLVRDFANNTGLKVGQIAQPLRVALTGSTVSPSVFEIMEILGTQETIDRLKAFENH